MYNGKSGMYILFIYCLNRTVLKVLLIIYQKNAYSEFLAFENAQFPGWSRVGRAAIGEACRREWRRGVVCLGQDFYRAKRKRVDSFALTTPTPSNRR